MMKKWKHCTFGPGTGVPVDNIQHESRNLELVRENTNLKDELNRVRAATLKLSVGSESDVGRTVIMFEDKVRGILSGMEGEVLALVHASLDWKQSGADSLASLYRLRFFEDPTGYNTNVKSATAYLVQYYDHHDQMEKLVMLQAKDFRFEKPLPPVVNADPCRCNEDE